MATIAITAGRYVDPNSKRLYIPSDLQLLEYWTLFFILGATTLAHGNAIGGDQAIARWTKENCNGMVTIATYAVDTRIDGDWPLAGHRRNRRMLIESAARALIAFPGHTGTVNCINEAVKLRIPVYQWDEGEERFVLLG